MSSAYSPEFVGASTHFASASASSLAVTLPAAGSSTAGIFLALVVSKNNSVHGCTTAGWTKIRQDNNGASFTASLWWAGPTAANPNFNGLGSAACSAQACYYATADDVTAVNTANTSLATGSTSSHTSGTISTTKANATAVYVDAAAANTALATPTGWTEDSDTGSATSVTRHTFGHKAIATSGTASGGTTATGAAATWIAWEIELYSAAAATGYQASKIEEGLWGAPPDNRAQFSKVEEGLLAGPPDNQARYSKVEVGLWIKPQNIVPGQAAGSFALSGAGTGHWVKGAHAAGSFAFTGLASGIWVAPGRGAALFAFSGSETSKTIARPRISTRILFTGSAEACVRRHWACTEDVTGTWGDAPCDEWPVTTATPTATISISARARACVVRSWQGADTDQGSWSETLCDPWGDLTVNPTATITIAARARACVVRGWRSNDTTSTEWEACACE